MKLVTDIAEFSLDVIHHPCDVSTQHFIGITQRIVSHLSIQCMDVGVNYVSRGLACVARGGRVWSHSGPPIPRKPAPETLQTLDLEIVHCMAVVLVSLLSTDTETLGLRKGPKADSPGIIKNILRNFRIFSC